mmetsp:Transcript_17669/g.36828  ORF Transcript_17669/g.36828 Transcript_17669/m.36828 type:complete len:204 (+) Transcript_17669:231-842(+)
MELLCRSWAASLPFASCLAVLTLFGEDNDTNTSCTQPELNVCCLLVSGRLHDSCLEFTLGIGCSHRAPHHTSDTQRERHQPSIRQCPFCKLDPNSRAWKAHHEICTCPSWVQLMLGTEPPHTDLRRRSDTLDAPHLPNSQANWNLSCRHCPNSEGQVLCQRKCNLDMICWHKLPLHRSGTGHGCHLQSSRVHEDYKTHPRSKV